MLTILAYKTNWRFLAYHLCEHRVIEVNAGDRLNDIIDSGDLTTDVLFQINLSNYAHFFSDTSEPHQLIEESGRNVLNKSLYDISKSTIQETLKLLELPSLQVDKDSVNPNDTVIIKSNLNYGGLFERKLSRKQRENMGITYDFSMVPSFNEYKVLPAKDISNEYWGHNGISIERFIENDSGSYIRIYKFRNKYVFSQAFMPGVKIKKINHLVHETYVLVDSSNINSVENLEYRSALNVAAVLFESQNIDLGTVDIITNNDGTNYIIDLNHTPFWGDTSNHHFIDHLANQDGV